MVRWLLLVFALSACAFPAPPPPTVVNRAPFPPAPSLDRPFLIAIPVTGYTLARFGFGVALNKQYDSDKVLGHYLTAYDWTKATFAGRTFWEGRGEANRREVADETSGPRYVLGDGGWSGLDPATGVLTMGTFPVGSQVSGQVTAEGRVVLASWPDGADQPAALQTFSLVTGQSVGSAVRLPAGAHGGQLINFRTKLAAGRFWIDTGAGEVYRYDPLTQELVLVLSEGVFSDHAVALLGAHGTTFLLSRYALGVPDSRPTAAEILVVDADDPRNKTTVALTLPQGGWISQGIDVQGTFYFLVSLPLSRDKPSVQQLWSFDPVTGTGTDTGLSLPLWGDGELFSRDRQIFLFSTMTKDDTLSVGRVDLDASTAQVSELSLEEAVRP